MLFSNPFNIYVNKENLYVLTRNNTFIINSSGKGSCGNFRIFRIDENKLKVFDPISNTIQTLLSLNNPTAITKFECNLYIIDDNKILNFNLKNFTLVEIKIYK